MRVLLVFIDDEELVTEFSFSFVQIRGWKAWEEETSSHGYEFANGMMSNDIFNSFSSSSVEFLNLLINAATCNLMPILRIYYACRSLKIPPYT